jgi:hypothetical protein
MKLKADKIMASKGISRKLDAFVEKTVWIWLPFVGFFILIKKILEKKKPS